MSCETDNARQLEPLEQSALFGRDRAVAVAVAVVGSLIAWLRLSEVTRGTIWAEDGRVFLMDALQASPFQTLLRPYDGYLHLVPRFIAELVTFAVPPFGYALALSAISCLVAGIVAALVYVCSSAVTESILLRLAFASVGVLVPSLPHEVLGNTVNLHWFFLWLVPWLLLYPPKSRTGSVLLGIVALVVAMTEIQTVFFLPLIIWRWRDRRGWPVRIGLLGGLVAQAGALVVSTRSSAIGAVPELHHVVAGYLINAVMTLWLGSGPAISSAIATLGWGVGLLATLPSLVALVVVLRRGTRTQRLAAVTFPAASAIVWTAGYMISRPALVQSGPGADDNFTVVRYAPLTSMFLLAGLLLALTTVPWPSRLARLAVAVLAVPLVVSMALNIKPADNERAGGPVWANEVATGHDACLRSPAPSSHLLGVAPSGWEAMVPCSLLVGK